MPIDQGFDEYVITNTTLQFTSYVTDLLRELSYTPDNYPFFCGVAIVDQGDLSIMNLRSFTVLTLDSK